MADAYCLIVRYKPELDQTCFLNPFMAAFTNPTRVKTMVAAANNHLINVAIAVTQASVSGADGKTESIVTIPRFSSKQIAIRPGV